MAGDADDHVGAAPPAYGRRRLTMPPTDMDAMRPLWCTILKTKKCTMRQMKNATFLQTKVSHDSKLGKLKFSNFQMGSDRHGLKGEARMIFLRWELYHWMQKKKRSNFLNHCTI